MTRHFHTCYLGYTWVKLCINNPTCTSNPLTKTNSLQLALYYFPNSHWERIRFYNHHTFLVWNWSTIRIIFIKQIQLYYVITKTSTCLFIFTAVEAYVFNLVFQHMLLHPGFSFNSSRLPKSLFRCFEQSSLLTIEKAIFQLWSQCPLCVNRRKIEELQHFPILKAFSKLANGLSSFIHHIETSGIFRFQSNQSCKSFWLKFCLQDYSTDIPTKISWQRYVIFPEFIGMSHILANCRILYEHIAYCWLQG